MKDKHRGHLRQILSAMDGVDDDDDDDDGGCFRFGHCTNLRTRVITRERDGCSAIG